MKPWLFSTEIKLKFIYLGLEAKFNVLDLASQGLKSHGKEHLNSAANILSPLLCRKRQAHRPSSPASPRPRRPQAEHTSKRRGLYTVSGSSIWPRWPAQLLKSCTQVEHTSLESAGPRAKSYKPFTDGFPRLSRYRGFVIDLTLNFLRFKKKKKHKGKWKLAISNVSSLALTRLQSSRDREVACKLHKLTKYYTGLYLEPDMFC